MKFVRDQSAVNSVRKIERGSIVIGDTRYTRNVGLLSDRIIEDWPQQPLSELDEATLEPILEHGPELLLIGSGWENSRPPRELLFALARRGIGLEVMDTPAACRTFNILISENRLPAALLYLDG